MMKTNPLAVLGIAAALLIPSLGCETDCDRARKTADQAWAAYAQALTQASLAATQRMADESSEAARITNQGGSQADALAATARSDAARAEAAELKARAGEVEAIRENLRKGILGDVEIGIDGLPTDHDRPEFAAALKATDATSKACR